MPESPGNIQSSTMRSGVLSFSVYQPHRHAPKSHLVAFRLKVVAEQQGQRLFVFDNQYACVHARCHYLSPAARSEARVVVSPFGR